MHEKKEDGVQKVEGFQIAKKPPHISEFDTKIRTDIEESKAKQEREAVTIDDDQPDYE